LWAGAILCFIGFGLQQDRENLLLGIVLAFVVIITGVFEYLQERTSSNLMESFRNMMPQNTLVVRTDNPAGTEINARLLVKGDIIKIKGGDKIPADCRVIIASDDMAVEQSSLTGEPDALERMPQGPQEAHENPLETKNLCFFGTSCPSGTATAIVVNTGDRTVMGRISQLATAQKAQQQATPINREIQRFVALVSSIAIFLGITFLIINFVILGAGNTRVIINNFVFMIGIIVANVPEGLLATVTVCLTLTAQRMASKMVLVKNTESVETLGSTTCICSDKTGTLTINDMTVANVVYDNRIYETLDGFTNNRDMVDSDGVSTVYPLIGQSDIYATEEVEDSASFKRLLRCATLCNVATFEKKKGQAFRTIKTLKDGSTLRQVLWKCNGNASDSAMIKFAQDKQPYNAEVAQLMADAAVANNKAAEDQQIAFQARLREYSRTHNGCSIEGPDNVENFNDFHNNWNKEWQANNPPIQEITAEGVMAMRETYPLVQRSEGSKELQWNIPFNSGNKYAMSVHRLKDHPHTPAVLCLKGASERIIGRCSHMFDENGQRVPLTPERRKVIDDQLDQLMNKGRRVLAFAEKELDVQKYGPDFKFNTGAGQYNFPMGEYRTEKECRQALMPQGTLGVVDGNAAEVALAKMRAGSRCCGMRCPWSSSTSSGSWRSSTRPARPCPGPWPSARPRASGWSWSPVTTPARPRPSPRRSASSGATRPRTATTTTGGAGSRKGTPSTGTRTWPRPSSCPAPSSAWTHPRSSGTTCSSATRSCSPGPRPSRSSSSWSTSRTTSRTRRPKR
jgi:magnesium-transporting ATPase (P-type)